MSRKKISVLHASAECVPFAKIGGLGDVLGSLPQALSQLNVLSSVITPLYGSISKKRFKIQKLSTGLAVEHNGTKEYFSIWGATLPKNPVRYFFIEHPLFRGPEIYTSTDGAGSRDIERFSFFSQAVVEAVNTGGLSADLIHCHDWHTGLLPTFVDQLAVAKQYPFTKTVLTIHNLGNQGVTRRDLAQRVNLTPESEPAVFEDYYDLDGDHLNILKIGVLSADWITTVSSTYAREILTPRYGAGLESFLLRRKKNLSGIINGINPQTFNPARDHFITHRYTAASARAGKNKNKAKLQKELGLPILDIPFFGVVSRMVAQKGFDILFDVLAHSPRPQFQIAILGTGEKPLEAAFTALGKKLNNLLSVNTKFDIGLAQRIYAGSDFFLMPSRFEPCGLGQMIAMRYGTIPVVRKTGGLADTVHDRLTGVVFDEYSKKMLSEAVARAVALYRDEKKRYTMVKRCMRQDFSWGASARHYQKLYQKLI